MEKKKMSSKLSVAALIFSVIIFPVGIILAVIDLVKMLDPKYREEYGHLLSYFALGISAFFLIIFTFSRAYSNEAEEPPKEEAMVLTEVPETTASEPKQQQSKEEPQPPEQPEPEKESDPLESSGLTFEQKNAVSSAIDYLNFRAFSRQGLIDQLSSEYGSGFSVEDATAAVNFLEDRGAVDWNEQAEKAAQEYLDYKSFSKNELIDQLSSEYGSQFTKEQAEHGAAAVGF